MNKTKRTVIAVIVVTLVLVAALVLVVIRDLFNYMNNVPKINAKESIVVDAGDTLGIDELATIENYRSAEIRYTSDDESDIVVSEDKQSIYVGTNETEFDVSVFAQGVEARDEMIKIKVVDNNG